MDEPKGTFQDFIPPGEEKGSAYGNGGFQDFVPAPEPELQELTSEEQKKQAFLDRMAKGREAKKAVQEEAK